MYSKSILRAVVEKLKSVHEFVDYFPSYEIAINPWCAENNWNDDKRTVTRSLVSRIMKEFFDSHKPLINDSVHKVIKVNDDSFQIQCDEVLLDLFSTDSTRN